MALTNTKKDSESLFCTFDKSVLVHYSKDRGRFASDYDFLRSKWALKGDSAVKWRSEEDMHKYQTKFITNTPYQQLGDWWWEKRNDRERVPLIWWFELKRQYGDFMRAGGGYELSNPEL